MAISEISSQIATSVSTTFSSNVNIKNEDTSKDLDFKSLQKSSANISGYKLLKHEHLNNVYYVAVGYNNISGISKFNQQLSLLKNDTEKLNNSYLASTMVAAKVKSQHNFRLKRKNNLWYINYKNIYQPLESEEFAYFFTTVINKNMELNISIDRNFLYDGEEFYFKVKSNKNGYVSLLVVYEDGTVAILDDNIEIHKDTLISIPRRDSDNFLEAGLIENRQTFDMYIAIYSEKKVNYDLFTYMDSELINDERFKNFDDLIEFIDKKEYATLKLITKPKKH